MRVIYVADDGTMFEDAWECESYESRRKHPELCTIDFYDRDDKLYRIESEGDVYDAAIYNDCEQIHIHNQEEFESLMWLTKECGYCEFEQITGPGFWVRETNEDNWFIDGHWVKVE